MGSGGNDTSLTRANAADQLKAYRTAKQKWEATGEWDEKVLGKKPQGYDSMSREDQRRYVENWQGSDQLNREKIFASQLGDDYVDPTTGRSKNSAPLQKDLTDDLLTKTRTNTWNRLQMGKSMKNSFSGGLGGVDLEKPVLGGY